MKIVPALDLLVTVEFKLLKQTIQLSDGNNTCESCHNVPFFLVKEEALLS
jgi:hypothetical protein